MIKHHKIKVFTHTKLRLELYLYPPDAKKRDIDNVCKAILDALQYAEVYDDDYKVWQLYVERKEVRKYGEVEIRLSEI